MWTQEGVTLMADPHKAGSDNGSAGQASDLSQAIGFLLSCLQSADEPIPPEKLLLDAWKQQDLSSFTTRLALWELVHEGKLELTPDWKFRLKTFP